MNLSEKCRKITTIVLDVDGVLTNGSIGYGADGKEIKFFNVRDGHGIVLARRAGLKVGILSGRQSEANRTRAKELSLDFLYEKCHDKASGFQQILEEQHLKAEDCMYIGDDVVDAPPMKMSGLGIAVGDAVPELDQVCDLRMKACGGCGAVREAVEFLLKEQGKWDDLMQRYFC